MTLLWLLAATVFLAFSNGANDNFKGVATLLGSRTARFRTCLWWAAITTFLGSLTSLLLARGLVSAFSGKGLVADTLTGDPSFLMAVGMGAGLTVMLATLTGFPISTTHALTGGLVGAGLAFGSPVDLARLGGGYFLPLAFSPLFALALAAGLYPSFRKLRLALGVERRMCLCREDGALEPVRIQSDGALVLLSSGSTLTAGQAGQCEERYLSRVAGLDAQWLLDRLHFVSAGLVGFARGLNDTPKIVALLVAAAGLGLSAEASLLTVGIAMAVGGLVAARRVAVTMSLKITSMNHGQGFTANLVTALLVAAASRWGLPVSTTHVSCGSLFGLGAVTGQGRWEVIRGILLAWVITLPVAAILAGLVGFASK